MTQLPGYKLWIFRGEEANEETRLARFRCQPVLGGSWYVGHAPGAEIASGPHDSERAALYDAKFMADTSGT